MSWKWWAITLVAFAVSGVALAVGFLMPSLSAFQQNVLAEIAGLGLAVGVAVWLIEGPLLTREQRHHKVVALSARSVVQLSEEIGIMLARDIADLLTSELQSNVYLYGEERGDWSKFKSLLRQVFGQAQAVPEKGPPHHSDLSKEEYLSYVTSAHSLVNRFRKRLGDHLEVHALLIELIEKIDSLDSCVTTARFPYVIDDEKRRFHALGGIGNAIIDVVEAGPRVRP